MKKILIANRGEIAVRIARSVAEAGMTSVAVHTPDDADSPHVRLADKAVALPGQGVAGYLDIKAIVAAARKARCDALHPGYGLLSENPALAEACHKAGITFIGPSAELLALCGDKLSARKLARDCEVPVLSAADTLEEARALLRHVGRRGGIMIKARAGGGGRGMRAVTAQRELDAAWQRCQAEAEAVSGDDRVYAEQRVTPARHVEVQILGDGRNVSHLWDRDCSLQRRHQKLVEIAPAPGLTPTVREYLLSAALRMAQHCHYSGLGTFEFLVDTTRMDTPERACAFIEINPRLQVEHTVTEQVTGLDLVRIQLALAAGANLTELGLTLGDIPTPRGCAVQLRINAEQMQPDGSVHPGGGTLTAFDPPSGPGIRFDTGARTGYTMHPDFDSLLGKLIAHVEADDYTAALARAGRALRELRVTGVQTNAGLLSALLSHPEVQACRLHTGLVESQAKSLLAIASKASATAAPAADEKPTIDETAGPTAPEGTVTITAGIQGRVIDVTAETGKRAAAGETLVLLEAMKMEYPVTTADNGTVHEVLVKPGDQVMPGQPLVYLAPAAGKGKRASQSQREPDPMHVRPDLAEVNKRHELTQDKARREAVAKRHKLGLRTARENIADLTDRHSFIEYGALAVAAQSQRRDKDDLMRNTPADGLITGVGTVNAKQFGEQQARCLVMAYDYTVLAGTQGYYNHRKKDRMLQLAREWKLPVVLFAEGGGGRPGDTDVPVVAGLDTTSFLQYARLSGEVPLVGIAAGRCFAGNAALLGCSDVVIATRDANIGMGGPAMIEGGGLGQYRPEDIGPLDVQRANGVVDIAVVDEAAAVQAAKQYLGYFQGDLDSGKHADPRRLRHSIPENRRRVYNVRQVIDLLADKDSVLELRRDFGEGIITALVRIEGRAMGLMASNPAHLGGAIDAPAADKAARFMQLCDAFDLPLVSLCDTPGFMVGPEAEETAQVRRFSRMFVTAASMKVPFFTIVLRKGYGLGAQAMAGGSFHAPVFIAAWPTGEFGGMGLEGAVRLGFRKELEAVTDPLEREKLFNDMVAMAYEHGKATNMASALEIDAVIDPADTRRWLLRGLASVPPRQLPAGGRRPMIDTW